MATPNLCIIQVAWAFSILYILIAAAIVLAFGGQQWWMPPAASQLARDFDSQFVITLVSTGFFLVLMHIILSFIVVRFRDGRSQADYWRGNVKWIWATVGAMAVLDLGLALGSESIWNRQHIVPEPQNSLRIQVIGQQFVWNVRYPGPDGLFGLTDLTLVDDATNPLGLVPSDTAAKDDLVIPNLVVPLGRPVVLVLGSKDVIHSFFVRELRIKQDAVPGMLIPLRFTADRTGRFEVACAELCGLGHHQMRTFLEVLEPAEYEERIEQYRRGEY